MEKLLKKLRAGLVSGEPSSFDLDVVKIVDVGNWKAKNYTS